MKVLPILQRQEVTASNQALFDRLISFIGKVPNLYAGFAWSANALNTYMNLQQSKHSLSARQREVVHLVVSGVNGCAYCLSAHTTIARMNDFTDDQITEIKAGAASFDFRLDVLAKLVKSIVENRGHVEETLLDSFYAAGYTTENLVDIVVLIGDMIMSNYLQALINVPIDPLS
ncbi:MAG: carboxymuconolactone decarboxylase family protein [Bacteroidetes bacterium]|nr:carboxymuconolactone decarboxylase family protein [Bacteroidota bacterium]